MKRRHVLKIGLGLELGYHSGKITNTKNWTLVENLVQTTLLILSKAKPLYS